jgi:hypothetical protein
LVTLAPAFAWATAGKQIAKPHSPAEGLGGLEREHPTRNRAGRGERREPATRGNRLVLAVELAPRIGARAAGSYQRAHASRGFAHEPNAVAAELRHVRINRADARRHCDRGLECIAALGQHRASGFDGCVMRRGHDPTAMSGGVEVDHSGVGVAASLRPRRLSKPSAVGNRPRNAV